MFKIVVVIAAVGVLSAGLAQATCSHITGKSCEEITHDLVALCMRDGSTLPNVNISFPSVQQYRDMLTSPLAYYSHTSSGASEQNEPTRLAEPGEPICKWNYVEDTDDYRIPRVIKHATCLNREDAYFEVPKNKDETSPRIEYQCRRIFYPINVLRWSCKDSQVKWYFTQEVVSFGCGLEKIIQ